MPSPATTSDPADRRVVVATPEAVAFDRTLADLGTRGLAFAVDLGILGLVLLAEAAVFVGATLTLVNTEAYVSVGPWILAAFLVVAFATFWGYFIVLEAAGAGRTPGKRVLRIRTVREDGSRIGVIDSLIRNFLLIADALPGTFAVGVTSIIVTGKAQRLGDLAAGTVVVSEGPALDTPPAPDPRARLAEEFIAREPDMTPEARAQVGAEVLRALDPASPDDVELARRVSAAMGGTPAVLDPGA